MNDLPRELQILLANPDAALKAIERVEAEESLAEFIRQAWPVLEPHRPLVWGWVLDAICEHLEAVTSGDITRLLINVPPGTMKSLSTRVFWPVWEWTKKPGNKYIGASYSEALALRDNRRARQVFTSEWYQSHWDIRISEDQSAKGRWENSHRGWMQATSVRGLGTGERGDRFIIDDPHNILRAESPVARDEALQWMTETVPSRLNDIGTSAIVVIMQRVHEQDISGHIIEHDLGYTHLMLPMEFEPERRCMTEIGFKDPRTEPGELLWPERFSAEAVDRLKSDLRSWGGTYAEAGQLQQRPVPREGGLFKADGFEVTDALPEVVTSIRYWDKGGTDSGGAYTAGVKVSELKDGRFMVEDCVRGQWSVGERERVIRKTAERDGKDTVIWMEQEPGSSGKDMAQLSIRNLKGFTARADKVTGSKETRAEPWAAQIEAGNVLLLRGPWNRAFIEEHRHFPRGQYKDQVDAAAGAFNKLMKRTKDTALSVGGEHVDNWARMA